MRAPLLIATATLAVAFAAAAIGDTADPYTGVRKEFQEAFANVANAEDSTASDSEKLKRYPLYSYLQAERLRKALGPDAPVSEDTDKRAAAFVAEHDPQPVSRR